MPVTSVSLLGETVQIAGDERDTYFSSFRTGDELADSVVSGVLPFVPADGVCLDIGANLGLYAIALARHFPQLQVYAFEPVPQTFKYLTENARTNAPQITAFPYACGTTDEIADMQFVDHFAAGSHFSVDGSLAKVNNEYQSVAVQVKRVDTIAAELGLDRIDLIKIDVEGFELDVLRGAADTLARHQPIVQVEFNSWTFMSHRRILPQEVVDEVCRTFPYVYVHERHGDRLARLLVPLDQQSLLYANAVHGGVDNLLCAFTELAPDAPRFADVWPEFVRTRDVQVIELHQRIENLEAHVDGLEDTIAEKVRGADVLAAELDAARAEIQALQATISWRVTTPLRAVRTRMRRG